MKDYRLLKEKQKSKISLVKKNSLLLLLKFRVFDLVVIFVLLNLILLLLALLYMQKIHSYAFKGLESSYREIKSVPNLPLELSSINASASAFVVYDPESRSLVAEKNQSLRFSPASTAKIMSSIVSLSHYNLDEFLVVPEGVNFVQGSKMKLIAGEQISVRNLLYGMMLPSGNDAAYTLAYNYPNGVLGFVDAMNNKARELKLKNTHFEDPDGYDDGNYTTAFELARLSAFAMQNPTFRDIVATPHIEFFDKSGFHAFELDNLNELLSYGNVVGIKTGFTNEAGGVLVTGIMKNNKLLIVVVLKSPDRFSDTQDLMRFINEKVDFLTPLTNLKNRRQ